MCYRQDSIGKSGIFFCLQILQSNIFFAYFGENLGLLKKINIYSFRQIIFILMKNFICDIFNEP